jgi:hypothetical protein
VAVVTVFKQMNVWYFQIATRPFLSGHELRTVLSPSMLYNLKLKQRRYIVIERHLEQRCVCVCVCGFFFVPVIILTLDNDRLSRVVLLCR